MSNSTRKAIIFPKQVGFHVAVDRLAAETSEDGPLNSTSRSEIYHAGVATKADSLKRFSGKVATVAAVAAYAANVAGAEKIRDAFTVVAVAASATALGSAAIGEANLAIAQAHTDQLHHKFGVKLTSVELAQNPASSTIQ